jgi:uncharacterized protein
VEQRVTPADLEIRGGSEGRTICGIAVPFDSPTEIRESKYSSFTEVFRPSAFRKTIADGRPERIKVFGKHLRAGMPVGRALLLREDPVGLYAELGITKTQAGDEILAMVRDSTLDGLSIGFEALRDKWSPKRDFVERLEAKLREVSVVDWPAYENAVVTGVRSEHDRLSSANALRRISLLERL